MVRGDHVAHGWPVDARHIGDLDGKLRMGRIPGVRRDDAGRPRSKFQGRVRGQDPHGRSDDVPPVLAGMGRL